MLEAIHQWIFGVTCAAMLVAAAQSLMPKGPVGRIGRITGGLVLLLALLAPVVQLDEEALARALSEYRLPQEQTQALAAADAALFQSLIVEGTSAYISEQAQNLGIICTVSVETRTGEDGYPVPWAVTVTGPLTGEEREALTRRLEADLAIPEERQSYQTEEES